LEIQPSVRSLWNVTPTNAVWAAVSRAVRTPSRAADAATLNNSVRAGTPPVQIRILGNDDVKSEELTAFELGFKSRPLPSLTVDIAAFYNVYDKLVTTEAGSAFLENTPAPAHIVQPLLFANNMSGEAHGLELSTDWRARNWLRLRGSYTLFELVLHRKTGTGTASNEAAEKRDPRHQFSLNAEVDLGSNVEMDATFRAIDRLSERNIRGYATADLRLAWKPVPGVELSLVGRNLLQSHRAEARPEFLSTQTTEVERSFYGSLKLEF
jgi:iron complex outermembrane receptor protein